MSENEEPVTAGSMLASILKGKDEFTEKDLTRQIMKQIPHATTVSNGVLVGSRNENGEIIIEDLSVSKTDTIQ